MYSLSVSGEGILFSVASQVLEGELRGIVMTYSGRARQEPGTFLGTPNFTWWIFIRKVFDLGCKKLHRLFLVN